MLVGDDKVEHALKALHDYAAAQARAANEFLSDFTKVLLAQLADQAPDEIRSDIGRERWARKHPDFMKHLLQKREAAELDYKHRQRIAASLAVIDAWRTEQASDRAAGRLG